MKYSRPPLYALQEEAIFGPTRFVAIEASTKSGKTHGCIVWLLEQAILHGGPNKSFYWIAPVVSQANTAWRRFIEEALAPVRHLCTIRAGERYIKLWNGSMIWFKSADNPDSLYSDDVYGVVVGEASRCKEETLPAVMSILTKTAGPARFIGNVKGKGNFFYTISRKAQSGKDPEWAWYKITAYDAARAGILSWAVIQQAERDLLPHIFKMLYLAEPSDLATNPFGKENILACIGAFPEKAAADNEIAVWGWDLGKRVDWTVGIALNKKGAVIRFHRWQLETWDKTIKRISHISGQYPTYIDSTGLGDPVLDLLIAEGHTNIQGYKFSNSSKQNLMESLGISIQGQTVSFPEGLISQELLDFEYVIKADQNKIERVYYGAPDGYHDDCVCALAMANWCFAQEYIIDPPHDIEVLVY